MSVVETDDRGTVLHYAPRHVRYPSDEHSIRPILERLSRGENDAPVDAPAETPGHAPLLLDPPRRTGGWELIACSTFSALLSAGLAVVAIGWMAPSKTEPGRIETMQVEPKAVRTNSIQPTQETAQPTHAPAKEDTKTEAAATPAQAEAAPSTASQPRHDPLAPKELLAMWSGIPAETRADAPADLQATRPAADVSNANDAEAEAPPVPRGEHREPRHQAHTRPHRRHRAYAAHRANASEEHATTAQTSETNPIQSALQSVFGKPAVGAQQQSPPQNY